MKKLLWILIAMFLFVGCSKGAQPGTETPAPEGPNPKGYMAEPQIIIGNGHQYKQESWIGESVELRGESIQLQGNSFNINIIFEGSVPADKFKEAVKVEGYDAEMVVDIIPSEGKTAYYANFTSTTVNKPYKLIISKDIMDSEGKTLKADIEKTITLKADTTALYTVIGRESTYNGLGWQQIIDAFAVGNMNWSPDPKTIVVDFSAEVDQASVENSIKIGLSDKTVKYSVEWDNDKKLTLKLEGLKAGEPEPYLISMAYAKDLNGNPVYGNLYFVTSKHNTLGSIDIKGKKSTEIYKFPDKRYMAVQSSRIGNHIILDDTEVKYVFDMTGKKVSDMTALKEYTRGIPSLSFTYTWLDNSTVVLVNKDNGKVIRYSLPDGKSEDLFTLPEHIIKSHIIEISASPDGSKLALAYEILPAVEPAKHDFMLSIFDLSGKSLYIGENVFMPRFLELFGSVANMGWMDNSTLILEDNISKENQMDFNVISVNIQTGNKTIVAEHAFKPVVLKGTGLLKVESFKDFGEPGRSIDILKNGSRIKSFKAESYQYDNFFFSNENTLVYNEGEKIFAYYIDKGKSEQLGKGYIVGLSEDGSRILYMTNHRMLYYID